MLERVLAASAPSAAVAGKVMNAACGTNITVETLCRKLIEYCDLDLEPIHQAPRPGDILHSHADISQARTALQYEPRVDFDTGLRRTYEWFAAQRQGQGEPATAPRQSA